MHTPRIFCHRGFYGVTDVGAQSAEDAKGAALGSYPPENSEASIVAAFQKGLSVEMDVTMTKDRQIIVTHTNDLTVHSPEAQAGDYVSEKTLAEIQAMRTGLGGRTAPFLTYDRFIELLSAYPAAFANVEIKGTIQAKLMSEPTNPSLIDRLVEETPLALQARIIWSSFANSNIMAMKARVPDAQVAQLFAEPGRYTSKGHEDPVYPDRDDAYLQFNVRNLILLSAEIGAVHPSIDSLATKDGVAALEYCADRNITVRTWALAEKNPLRNQTAIGYLANCEALRVQYPKLSLDYITDYAADVKTALEGIRLKPVASVQNALSSGP